MIEAVKELAQSSDKSNGPRRMNHALNALGYSVGRQKARPLRAFFCELEKGTCAVAKLPDPHGITAGHSGLRCDVLYQPDGLRSSGC
jgi:hypothetical protein